MSQSIYIPKSRREFNLISKEALKAGKLKSHKIKISFGKKKCIIIKL